jgi:hypothetical protein
MSYQLRVIKDYPLGFWPLDESSGSTASDKSGCGNNATYVGSPASNILPLVSGGISGTEITDTAYITVPITKDYYGANVGAGFGTKYTSDNDFSMEVWFHPTISSTSEVRIFADTANNVGIFWHKNDIVFKISSTELVRYAVPYHKKVMHVVATYNPSEINLYLDGVLAENKTLSDFKFTNTTLNLQIGPTPVGDSFIVDAPAVYRYAISERSIIRHNVAGNIVSPAIQVVQPDQGTLFSCTDARQKPSFEYSYPINRPWTYFLDDNTYYDILNKEIGFKETETVESKTFIIEDFFLVPDSLDLNSSKIEWRNDYGVLVETSIDGTNWLACTNGQAIPQYSKDSFSNSGRLYLKITMSTTDASKFFPKLSYFSIKFYGTKTLYADNFGDKITSTTEYSLGSINYPILSRNYTNGLRTKNGAGFDITTASSIKSVEMMFTPSSLASNTLFYASAPSTTRFAWNGSGVVSKANISKVYVNNVDVTNQTNISSYLNDNEPHHVVLVFTTPVSGTLQINYETSGGPDNLYKNIAIYEKELTAGIVETHYELYIGRAVTSKSEPTITLTESDFIAYNNDWIVLQSV